MKKYIAFSLVCLFAAFPLFARTHFEVLVSAEHVRQYQRHLPCHYNLYHHYLRCSPVVYVMRRPPVIVERVYLQPAPRIYIIKEFP